MSRYLPNVEMQCIHVHVYFVEKQVISHCYGSLLAKVISTERKVICTFYCVITVKEGNDIAIKHIIVMYVDRQTLPYTRNFSQIQQFKMFCE